MMKDNTDCVLKEFAQNTIKEMIGFIDETSIYKHFPAVKLKISNNREGCMGGVVQIKDKLIAAIQISIPHITAYTAGGFTEYKHIEDDPEIGSLRSPVSWKHTLTVVLCHELAHAVVMMHAINKRHGLYVPRTFHAYSVEMIQAEYAKQKRYHGRHWQYVYRELRNNFANNKEVGFW